MSSKTQYLCLFLIVTCINHEALSQAIKDFQLSISFPGCRKAGAARNTADLIKFSAVLITKSNFKLDNWNHFVVMFHKTDVLRDYKARKWIDGITLTNCTTSSFWAHTPRTPQARCAWDRQIDRLLHLDMTSYATSKYSEQNFIGVWFNKELHHITFQTPVKYPIVVPIEVETLMVGSLVMPGKTFYVNLGRNQNLKYCVNLTSMRIAYFTLNKKTVSATQKGNPFGCVTQSYVPTNYDLNSVAVTYFIELDKTCLRIVNSSANFKDANTKHKAVSEASSRPEISIELVLLFLSLTAAWDMYMS